MDSSTGFLPRGAFFIGYNTPAMHPRIIKHAGILWTAIIVFLLSIRLTYIPNGFTWLDHGDIQLRRAVVSLDQLPSVLLSRYGITGFYRPMVTLIHTLDAQLYGLWAPGFHLTNVILHIAVSVVAALFIGSFFPLTLIQQAVIIFVIGIHPASWLPVGAISYRQEILVLLFSMLALIFHAKTRSGTGRISGAALAITNMLLALLSKESALYLVPLFILLWEGTTDAKKRMKGLLPAELGVFALYGILRAFAVPELWRVPMTVLPLVDAVGTRLTVLEKLLIQLVTPLKPGLSDATRVTTLWAAPVLLPVIMLMSIAIGVIRSGWRSPWAKAFTLLVLPLVAALHIVPLPRFFSVHYAYASLPGLAFVLVLMQSAWKKRYINILFNMLLILWISISSVTTWQAGKQFFDDRTLFEPEVKRDDYFAEGHQYLGDYYFKDDQYMIAQDHYMKALRQFPTVIAFADHAAVLNNLAGTYIFQNKLEEADQTLIKLSQFPGWEHSPTLLYNRALIADRQNDWEKIIDLLKDVNLSQNRSELIALYLKALTKLGRTDEIKRIPR